MPYEEMDYTKMGQQMYYVPQQQHKPPTQDSSSKTKAQSPNMYMQHEEVFFAKQIDLMLLDL
jgi:hypothetical protein